MWKSEEEMGGKFSLVSWVAAFLYLEIGRAVVSCREEDGWRDNGDGEDLKAGAPNQRCCVGKALTSRSHHQVYFGFTHCPDICPEELDKMASMLDLVNEALPSSNPQNPPLLPLFITCDPARDTPSVLKTYLKEFHPNMIGLTGTWEQIKAVCKLYRVYFSTPQGVQPGMDYLVDHSIYFYLMGTLLLYSDTLPMPNSCTWELLFLFGKVFPISVR